MSAEHKTHPKSAIYFDKGIQYISKNMYEDGMVKTYSSDASKDVAEYEDLVTFTTGLTGLILSEVGIENQHLNSALYKMYAYVKSEIIDTDFWMWAGLRNKVRKFIPIDIDTCSLNSEFMLTRGLHLNNREVLAKNKPNKGNKGFYTWLILRKNNLNIGLKNAAIVFRHSFYSKGFWKLTPSRPYECNDIVSMNLFHYLILEDKSYLKKAERFLSQFPSVRHMSDHYYRDDYYNNFFVSRVLRYSENEELRNRFTPQPEDITVLRDLDLACLILTYKLLEQSIPNEWKQELKDRQQPDGGWNPYDNFTYGGHAVWRSPGLNTAFALAALTA